MLVLCMGSLVEPSIAGLKMDRHVTSQLRDGTVSIAIH